MSSRGLRVGLGLGLLSWVGLGLLDGGYGALIAPLTFESAGERLWFGALVWLTLLAPAVMLGLCQGALGPLVGAGARRLSRSTAPGRTAPWVGRLVALLCAPAVGAVCAQIFRGPRAQRIPGHDLGAVLIGVLGLVLLSTAVQLVLGAVRWVDGAGPQRRRRSVACGLAAAALAAGAYGADLRVLPRLYPWFHLSLLALTISLAQVAALFFALGAPVLRRRWLNLAPLAPAVALLAVATGAWGLSRLDRAAVLRAAALEHTSLAARVLWLNARLHPSPEALPEPAPPEGNPSPGDRPPPPVIGPRLPDTDVFLITVDALRADRLAPGTMPFAARLAERGVRFDRAYTQVPHTSFAVATLLTGKPVYALLQLGQDAADHETLPMVLRRARYKTAAFYPPSVFFIERERLKRLEESAYGFEYVKFEYLDAPRRTQQVIDFLESERPERAFVWVHYLEPHEPYEPHPGGPGAAAPDRARYDGEVRFVDAEIERLVTYLRGRRPGSLVILGADHGEEFGEHGGRYHGTTLYEEQVRVPLAFCDLAEPPRIAAARRPEPVGLIDVAPTVLGLLDIAPSLRMRGRDLGPLLSPGSGGAARATAAAPVFGEIGRKKMVVLGDHKLICDLSTDACALYDLAADPGERRSLYGVDAALTARLRGELGRLLGEASRFEREQAAAADLGAAERDALQRGRLGDRGAAPGLRRLIAARRDEAQTREATALLAGLCLGEGAAAPCADDETRAALRGAAEAKDPLTRSWARVGLALGGDAAARAALAAVVTDEAAPAALRLAAALGLGEPGVPTPGAAAAPTPSAAPPPSAPPADGGPGAAPDRVALWAAALPAAMSLDDPERVRPLLRRLGRSGNPRALPVLRAQLGDVRSRLDVVTALGELGQGAAVPDLLPLLSDNPYVPVRAAAATALGRLGGAQARSALERARRREREAQVLEAIRAALRAASSPSPAPAQRGGGRQTP